MPRVLGRRDVPSNPTAPTAADSWLCEQHYLTLFLVVKRLCRGNWGRPCPERSLQQPLAAPLYPETIGTVEVICLVEFTTSTSGLSSTNSMTNASLFVGS